MYGGSNLRKITWYLLHNIKHFTRSKHFAPGLIGKILQALIFPYLVFMSFQMNLILQEIAPNQPPVESLNSVLLYIFIMFFISGLIFQKIPFGSVKQYLHLNIEKAKIVHLLIIRTISGLKSLIAIALFTPFAFISVAETHSIDSAIFWLLNILLSIFSINLLIQTIKFTFQKSIKIAIIFTFILAVFFLFGHFGLINIFALSSYMFDIYVSTKLSILVTLAVFLTLYYMNNKLLLSEFYLDKF